MEIKATTKLDVAGYKRLYSFLLKKSCDARLGMIMRVAIIIIAAASIGGGVYYLTQTEPELVGSIILLVAGVINLVLSTFITRMSQKRNVYFFAAIMILFCSFLGFQIHNSGYDIFFFIGLGIMLLVGYQVYSLVKKMSAAGVQQNGVCDYEFTFEQEQFHLCVTAKKLALNEANDLVENIEQFEKDFLYSEIGASYYVDDAIFLSVRDEVVIMVDLLTTENGKEIIDLLKEKMTLKYLPKF